MTPDVPVALTLISCVRLPCNGAQIDPVLAYILSGACLSELLGCLRLFGNVFFRVSNVF